jgi:multidrug efflux pump subunit AcrB
MDIIGFSLNMVSLLAITPSTGILVDDAIVEIENIVRHIRMGKSLHQAESAADEIGLAVIEIASQSLWWQHPHASSIPGQFFKQFTHRLGRCCSRRSARLITPMLAAIFSSRISRRKADGRLRLYKRVSPEDTHRFITIVLGLAIPAAIAVQPSPSGCRPRIRRGRCLPSSCHPARN